jgi:hypothetical protein
MFVLLVVYPGRLMNQNDVLCVLYSYVENRIGAISWQEQVHFQWDDDEVRFVLDQHAELDFYSASSLKQQSAGRHVD